MSDLLININNCMFGKSTKKDKKPSSTTITITDYNYGITGAGQSSPSLTRTLSNSGKTATSQDLIDFFVADTDVTDSLGNHFVKLKKFYVYMSQDSNGVMTYKLSHYKVNSNYFLNPYFKDKDGNEIDFAYYGKYKGYVSSSKLCSKSGVTPTYSTTIDNYRTYARNNGANYHQTDWCAVFTAQIMLMCVYATTQATNILTYRSYGSATGSGTQILGIEDIIGNGYEDVDGVCFYGGSALGSCAVAYDEKISDYKATTTTNKTTLTGASGSSGYIKTMYYASGKPALSIFPKTTGGSSSTYYCDYFYMGSSSGSAYLSFWGAGGASADGGLFYMSSIGSWSYADGSIGARLHSKSLI